jgi:hypothetical protein
LQRFREGSSPSIDSRRGGEFSVVSEGAVGVAGIGVTAFLDYEQEK